MKSKRVNTIEEVILLTGLKDGMTISFHHHLRSGDLVMMKILNVISEIGIQNLTLNVSSLTSAHESLISHIESGVITEIHTSGMRGKLAKAISKGNILEKPVIFRTHGGRARAIESGEVTIQVAFIAASCCDALGNMNGQQGPSAFGSMGYPMVDAKYAQNVVAVTDNLVPYPAFPISIPQTSVDYVLCVDAIGIPQMMNSRVSSNPTELLIAKKASNVLIASGLIKDQFTFQAGSGGISLAVIQFLKDYLMENQIKGAFASGGITKQLVQLLEEEYFEALLDTQTFDSDAAKSMLYNPKHIEMSASMYANPATKTCVAENLDIMILSATEIDLQFNVNVLTSSLGIIMGAQGGHPDTAEEAKLRVVVTPLLRKRIPIVVEKVTTIITKGKFIDVLITDYGICVNPIRTDLIDKLTENGINCMDIKALQMIAEKLTGKPEPIKFGDKIVGIVESRHGEIIDQIYNVLE